LTTKEIIEGCCKENPKYQRLLVVNYSSELLSVARRYMPDKMLAEDILQESFIKAFDHINSYDENKGNLGGWLRKIVINTALKKLNKKCFSHEIYSEKQYDITLHPSIYEKLDAEDLMTLIEKLPDG
jgi:RNA polymerase sigma-70 factor (ECF subfamily)